MKLKANPSSFLLLALLVAAAIMVAIVSRPEKKADLPEMHSLANWQRADVPSGFPREEGKVPTFDPRFVSLSAFEKAVIPTAPQMTAPLGSETGAFSYNAQPFWSLNSQRGGHHSGDDLNGIGGMNTDFGDAVFSIGNGRVLFAGEASPGWGKIVLVAHRLTSGQILQSMYAHLDQVNVSLGQTLWRGQKVGTVGTGNGNYLAHLHFELRDANTVDVLRGYLTEKGVHLSPSEQLNYYYGSIREALPSSAIEIYEKAKAVNPQVLPLDVMRKLK